MTSIADLPRTLPSSTTSPRLEPRPVDEVLYARAQAEGQEKANGFV